MRSRSLLLSTVLIGHMAFGAAAFAGDREWTVTRVASNSAAGADAHCALVRNFDSGVKLTIARNAADETTVALDFGKDDAVVKGIAVDVRMKTALDQDRKFEIVPTSGRGITVNMGRDDAFMNALEASGQMAIAFADKKLVFAESSMKSGIADLYACVGGGVEPASGGNDSGSLDDVPAMPKMAVTAVQVEADAADILSAPEKPVMRDLTEAPVKPSSGDSLLRKMQVDEAVREAPAKAVEKVKETAKAAPPKPAPAPAPAPALMASSSVNTDLDNLREENTRLRNALERERREFENRFQQQSSSSATVSEMSEKLRLLEMENSDLKSRMSQLGQQAKAAPAVCETSKDDAAALSALSVEVENLRAENAKIKSDMTALSQAKTAGDIASAELEKLRTENNQIKAEMATLAQVKTTADTASAELAKLRTENTQIKAEMATLAQAKTAGEAANAELTRLKAENAQIKAEMATLSQAKTAGEAANAELTRLRTENTQMKAELASLQNAKVETGNAVAEAQSKAGDLATRLKTVEAERDTLKQQVVALEAKVAETATAAKTENTSQLQALETRLKDMTAERDRLTAELQTVKTAKTQADESTVPAQTELVQVKELLKKATDENMTLRQQVAALEAKSTAPSEELKTNMATVTQLRAAEAELAVIRAERDRLSEQLRVAKSAGGKETVIASANWDLEQATTRFNEAERETRRLGALLDEERAKCGREKKELEYMLFDPKIAEKEQTARLVRLEEELALTKQKLAGGGDDGKDQRIAQLEQQLATERARVDQEVQRRVADLERSYAQRGSVQAADGDDRGLIDALKAEVASLNTQLSNLHSEKSSMASQLAQANSTLNNRTAETVSKPAVQVSYDRFAAIEDKPRTQPVAYQAPAPVQKSEIAAPTLAVVQGGLVSGNRLEQVLRGSGITLSQNVQPIAAATNAGQVAYRWEAGAGVFGSAEQKILRSPADFDTNVQEYLKRTESRCKGQFAAVPAAEGTVQGGSVSTYEIACVDDSGAGASASLLFAIQDSMFTAIAHEAAPESMDMAMDVRDRLVSGLKTQSLK